MVVIAPERSRTQRLDALERANYIRFARKDLKLDLKQGKKSLREQLEDPPEYLETMKVFSLLKAAPKIGPVKANKILSYCRISPSKTVGGLTERQRQEILAHISR